jgi:hypothetical protein
MLTESENMKILIFKQFRPSKKNVLVLRQWISKKGQGR